MKNETDYSGTYTESVASVNGPIIATYVVIPHPDRPGEYQCDRSDGVEFWAKPQWIQDLLDRNEWTRN